MSNPTHLRTALGVAFRHFDDPSTSDPERDAILVSMIESLGGQEGEFAARMLQNRRDNAALQLELGLLLKPGNGATS